MNTQTFFSVIIPSFNRRHFLKAAVDSVLAQEYGAFELIVVDDGSTDGTEDLMASYKDSRILYIRQENKGVSSARNKGLHEAKGGFMAFLDSDDRWTPDKLERTAMYIGRYPDIGIFHTEEIWYRGEKLLAQKQKHKKPSGHVYGMALPLCCISISTAVVRKDIFESVGVFDEGLEACEDYDFWLRAASRYPVKLIPEYLTIKDGGRPDQLSQCVWGLDRFRIKALEKMLSSGSLDEKHYLMTFEELEKKCGIFALGAEKHGRSDEAEYYRNLPGKYI
ncbi:MAG: glycosyltransferase [Candidatus Omnitrophota bacterium]